MRKKITLIGGGNIGTSLAYMIATKGLGDIVILDQEKEYASGKALDIEESLPIIKKDISIIGTNDYCDIKNSDLIIVSAGIKRKPNLSRDDLLHINAKIIKEVAQKVQKYCPYAFVIIITNPLDIMLYTFLKHSGFLKNKAVGMGGTLDSSRFKLFLARELNVSVQDITSLILGDHGDTMIPLIRYTNVGGIPLSDLIKIGNISLDQINRIILRTKNAGGEIIKLLKNESACYAPAAATMEIAESYLNNHKKLFSCSVYLKGEYGLNDICMGVPAFIDANGVESVVQIELDDKEKTSLKQSVESINTLISKIN